jgi:nucleoside-triphosphatase THEP1
VLISLTEIVVFGRVGHMKVTVQKQLEQDMRRASEVMGVSEEELAERAVRFYLASIHQELELEKELYAWNQVSDEALLNMERDMSQ